MAEFAWRRRMTPHFGEQWVPFAELNVKSTAGRWRTFSVPVDSGAVISLMPRSAAELLGIQPNVGESIELTGVGGATRRYFVHRFETRIGDHPQFEMRIAVADSENVPPLLGRLDVLDRFQIEFDPLLAHTRISASCENRAR